MTIYLGEQGHIELQRQVARDFDDERVAFHTRIEIEDVNADAKRFSFTGAGLGLITGDRIEIARINAENKDLELVEGHDYPDWTGYAHVDAIGGIRLYRDFPSAIDGGKANAIDLVTPTEQQTVKVTSKDDTFRCLAQVRSYEITTQRETIDVTTLNQQFRNSYHQGLISGQGRVDCFWEHTRKGVCGGEDDETSRYFADYSAYLAHLCIRLEQGASFIGKFYIFNGDTIEPSVWYECQAIVTNVSVNVTPTQLITSTIDFVTTGPIRLQTGFPPAYLTKEEDNDFILKEDGGRLEVNIPEQ